jgi:hypothetical protein
MSHRLPQCDLADTVLRCVMPHVPFAARRANLNVTSTKAFNVDRRPVLSFRGQYVSSSPQA